MPINFFTAKYYHLESWVLAHCIATLTKQFCEQYLNLKNDPKGRLYDQMYMAARSVYANIAEGTARAATSKETEMKLIDVARGSIMELSEDYLQVIVEEGGELWETTNPTLRAIKSIPLDIKEYTAGEWAHDAVECIKNQLAYYTPFVEDKSLVETANVLFVLCRKLEVMLTSYLEKLLDSFEETGGFTEELTRVRIARKQQDAAQTGAPLCPQCGKPMLKKMVKKGTHQGEFFWGCSDYPHCTGTRRL